MEPQPLFILGAPRSGTTFFCCALNQHPLISVTNESRIFVLLKDLIEARSERPDFLDPRFQEKFRIFAKRHAGAWVEQFYREALGVSTPIWGDKHTSYGDPAVLSGRAAGVMAEPRSGSCLRLIRDCLPGAKFIHLHRHPWHVAASMKRRGWVESMTAGLQVWRQHTREIEGFFAGLSPDQQLTLSFAEIVEHPDAVAHEISTFLGLGSARPIARFLCSQGAERTPFSSPTSDLGELLSMRDPGEHGRAALGNVADMAERYGYSADGARPAWMAARTARE
jgi:hypothetical protein